MWWQISLSLLAISESLSGVFLSFYFWESTKDLSTVLLYHLIMFANIPVAAVISGFVSEKISPKLSFALGLLVKIAMLLLVAFGFNSASLVGLMNGLAIGLYAVSINALSDNLTGENIEKFVAIRSVVGSIVEIIVPFGAALLLSLGFSYSYVFILSSIFLLLSVIATLSVKTKLMGDRDYELNKVFRGGWLDHEKRILFQVQFLEGLKGGVLWALGGVVTLILVGGVGQWGVFNFAFSILGILLNVILARYIKGSLNKFLVITSGTLLSLACLLLASNFNLTYYIIYSFAAVLAGALGGSSFWGTINRIIRQDTNYEGLRNEYFVAIEFPTALGRMLPIVALLLLGVTSLNDLSLRLVYALIGIIPLLSFSLLNNSHQWYSSLDQK